ncbi:hypothetical protein E2C01_032570 [Portunus trituberculatus]|uniref:Uncharacterized protein n=1 Tax=Portunus trituberculatus TaxID=210409 RepID=A0A5B7EWC0_PORTR|nr:hypothetical protein [Portunus trituberculatus]
MEFTGIQRVLLPTHEVIAASVSCHKNTSQQSTIPACNKVCHCGVDRCLTTQPSHAPAAARTSPRHAVVSLLWILSCNIEGTS